MAIQYHTRQRIIVFIYQFNYSGYKYVQKELTVIHFLYLFNNGNKKWGKNEDSQLILFQNGGPDHIALDNVQAPLLYLPLSLFKLN